ncbi:MAG: (Fe-S)-binding protein [Hydrogenophilus sp.]|nr:(Fe-S)-binding protein [Hydrogenophilus sp.]
MYSSPVALFTTCLANAIRPNLLWSLVRLLRESGWEIEVPTAQTCCGQLHHNAGDLDSARAIARHTIALLEPYPTVILPATSCLVTLRHHYPSLFAPRSPWRLRAEALARKTHDALTFLYHAVGPQNLPAPFTPYRILYHDSCTALRMLHLKELPRQLLTRLPGLTLLEPPDAVHCCGFGGTFSLEYPELSQALLDRKIRHILDLQPHILTGPDLSCLLHLGGRLSRLGVSIRVYHILEILAGSIHTPDLFSRPLHASNLFTHATPSVSSSSPSSSPSSDPVSLAAPFPVAPLPPSGTHP